MNNEIIEEIDVGYLTIRSDFKGFI